MQVLSCKSPGNTSHRKPDSLCSFPPSTIVCHAFLIQDSLPLIGTIQFNLKIHNLLIVYLPKSTVGLGDTRIPSLKNGWKRFRDIEHSTFFFFAVTTKLIARQQTHEVLPQLLLSLGTHNQMQALHKSSKKKKSLCSLKKKKKIPFSPLVTASIHRSFRAE